MGKKISRGIRHTGMPNFRSSKFDRKLFKDFLENPPEREMFMTTFAQMRPIDRLRFFMRVIKFLVPKAKE